MGEHTKDIRRLWREVGSVSYIARHLNVTEAVVLGVLA